MRPEIIFAEDERTVRRTLSELLTANGYLVRPARNGAEALQLYREARPDLLLLDVMMPELGGYEVCETVRRTDVETPVLFLTALDSEVDELKGLCVGADAYIPKTVSDEVLLARIAAALRRTHAVSPTGDFEFDDWRVDPSKLSMRRAEGDCSVPLSEREVAILRCFAGHPGEVFSRDWLETRFWGTDFAGGESALKLTIFRLREKLGRSGALIRAIRGSGYVFRP